MVFRSHLTHLLKSIHMHTHAFFHTEATCDLRMPQLSQSCHSMCIFIEITTILQKNPKVSDVYFQIYQQYSFWSKEKCEKIQKDSKTKVESPCLHKHVSCKSKCLVSLHALNEFQLSGWV